MQPSKITAQSIDAFELKGSLFTLTVLHLLQTDVKNIVSQLDHSIKKTPKMFKNMPLVIDLLKVKDQSDIDFAQITEQLRLHQLIPVGVRHGSEQQHAAAQEAGLGLFSSQTIDKQKTSEPAAVTHTEILSKPIRSGQQVYARNANLVVLAPVSHGAEILADGCIHVYNTLRGRVLAGVSGDTSARIFCQKLEAELVSIAGYYKLQDDIQVPENATAMQIYLESKKICIGGL
jgi:septum site-determining protein MinC